MTLGARALHYTPASRAPVAQLALPPVCKSVAQSTSLTHLVCMTYTADALYTVSATNSTPCNYRVHCQRTQRCTLYVHFTLPEH